MLQANPSLTPNAVKAILQYTAQVYDGYDPLTQGAGFLNAAGAVRLARVFADPALAPPVDSTWSGHLLWGNQLIRGDLLTPDAMAWADGVVWGATKTPAGGTIDWGVGSRNVVWGMRCGGADCQEQWTISAATDERVVWGTAHERAVTWGTR